MRLAVLEKHEIVMWIEAEPDSPSIPTVSILLHDAAQSTQDLQSVLTRGTSISTFQTEQEKKDVHRYAAEIERQGIHADLEQVRPTKGYSSLRSMFYLLSTMRPMSGLLLTFVNGILTSGIYDTALVLRLNQRYGLNAMQAGKESIDLPVLPHSCDTDDLTPFPLAMSTRPGLSCHRHPRCFHFAALRASNRQIRSSTTCDDMLSRLCTRTQPSRHRQAPTGGLYCNLLLLRRV